MSGLSSFLRRIWRASLVPSAILSEDEAVDALPARPEAGRAWLLASVEPCGALAGDPVWRWGDIVAAMEPGVRQPEIGLWLSTAQAAERLGIARCTLDGMVGRAPAGLPGAPVVTGSGRRRRRWRWSASSLEEWMRAFAEWDHTRAAAKPATRSRSRRVPSPVPDGPVDWNAAGSRTR